jgi:hypothetical protein
MAFVLFTLVICMGAIGLLLLAALWDVAFRGGKYFFRPCDELIAVTPPEAVGLADYLRSHKDAVEVQRIHDQAARNADLLSKTSCRLVGNAVRCPLLGPDGHCSAAAQRPIHCWSWRGPDCPERSRQGAAPEIGEVEAGLCRGLCDAGLDGHLYELNSALATALEQPDAAVRWMRGENIFARCRRYESN